MTGRLRSCAAFVFLVVCLSTASAQTTYTVTDLGTLGDNPFSFGFGLNGSGQVTGSSTNPGTSGIGDHAFLYSNGVMTDLGVLDPNPTDFGTLSEGRGVNEFGQVAGTAADKIDGTVRPRAFLYSQGVMQDLGTLGGSSSQGYGLNDSGEVTGTADLAGGAGSHAFLYSNGQMQDLGTLPGYDGSTGLGINNSHQVTGYLSATGIIHAFLYSAGQMKDLGTLGGGFSQGSAINRDGQIAGGSTLVPDTQFAAPTHAFLYSRGKMKDLGTLGGARSFGFGINSFGQVVGASEIDSQSGVGHAFLYTQGRGMLDLNTLLPQGSGLVLSSAAAINDAGQITGGATVASGATHAFLLSPPPFAMLINLVRSDRLPPGIARHLEAKLRGAWADDPGSGDYCSDLSEFIAKVQSMAGNRLTAAQANDLLVLATGLRTSAGCY